MYTDKTIIKIRNSVIWVVYLKIRNICAKHRHFWYCISYRSTSTELSCFAKKPYILFRVHQLSRWCGRKYIYKLLLWIKHNNKSLLLWTFLNSRTQKYWPLCISKPVSNVAVTYVAASHSAHSHMACRRTFHKDFCDSACPAATRPVLIINTLFSVRAVESFRAFLTSLQAEIYQIPTQEKLRV
jgi:hypothetical protein